MLIYSVMMFCLGVTTMMTFIDAMRGQWAEAAGNGIFGMGVCAVIAWWTFPVCG